MTNFYIHSYAVLHFQQSRILPGMFHNVLHLSKNYLFRRVDSQWNHL